MLQPNTDRYYLETIATIEEQFSNTPGKAQRLFVLVNPAWRDKSSWGFWDSRKAQEMILDRYETTFAMDQFVMRGNKVSLLKVWPHDWSVFWTPLRYSQQGDDEDTRAQLLGTFQDRPDYQQMDQLLQEALIEKP